MAHLNEYEAADIPKEIMSNRVHFQEDNEGIFGQKTYPDEEESLSDVDDTMNRYKQRQQSKSSFGGTLQSSYGQKKIEAMKQEETDEEEEDEEEVPSKSFDSLLNKRDQNIKISNLLKKNREKLIQREMMEQQNKKALEEKIRYDNQEDTITLGTNVLEEEELHKVDRDLQSNERFIKENLPSSKYIKGEYESNNSAYKSESKSQSMVKIQATSEKQSPVLKVRELEPQSNYMKYLLKKQESQNSNSNQRRKMSPKEQEDRSLDASPEKRDLVKKSWEHPKFKNLANEMAVNVDEQIQERDLVRLDQKINLVRQSIEQHDQLLNRASIAQSYVESSIENTFRQKTDYGSKLHYSKYQDSEADNNTKQQFLDSIGSLSKDHESSPSRRNSTIKEATVSNMEETIQLNNLMIEQKRSSDQPRRPQSEIKIYQKQQHENSRQSNFRNTEQKEAITTKKGLTTMDSIEPFKQSERGDNLTMGNVMKGENLYSLPESRQESMAQLQFLNANSSKQSLKVQENVFYPEQQQAPYVQVYPNKQFNEKRSAKIPRREVDPLLKYEVPDDNLMAVCVIKHIATSGGNSHVKDRSKSMEKSRRFGSRQNSARSNSLVMERGRQRLNQDRSLGSFRSHESRSLSGIYKRAQQSGPFGNTTTSSNIDLSSDTGEFIGLKRQVSKGLQFFTTHCQSSHIVLKQMFDDRIPDKLIKSLLRYDVDCNKFLTGFYEDAGNLRLYQFDKCLSEIQHSRQLNQESWQFLRAWLIHSKVESEELPLKFCFMFGSQDTQKSEMLNLMNQSSMLNEFLKELRDPIEFLKITMFFQDQEFVLSSRQFDNKKQSKREIGMEIREALRDRTRLVQKLTQQQPNLANYIQKCSHFRIQVNNYVFVDMADLKGLQNHDDIEVVQTLTNDFGSMTNEILRQSQYYENHEFQLNPEQESSAFNHFLRESITKDSKILLLTFISNDAEDEISSSIALDFSHKIKQYYHGNSDECIINQIVNEGNYDRGLLQHNFQNLQTIFVKLQSMKKRVNRELLKIEKQYNLNSSFSNIQTKILSYKRLQQLFDEFRDYIQQAIHSEFAQVFDNLHLAFIESQLGTEMDSVHKVLLQLNKLLEKRNPGSIDPARRLIIEQFPAKKSRSRAPHHQNFRSKSSNGGRGNAVNMSQQFKSSSNPMVQYKKLAKSNSGKLRSNTVQKPQVPPQRQKITNQLIDRKTLHQMTSKVIKKKMSVIEQQRSSSRLSQLAQPPQKPQKLDSHRSNSKNKKRGNNPLINIQESRSNLDNQTNNDDIPLNSLREKLTNDIENSLSSLKRKRSTINVDVNNHQVLEYKSNMLSDGSYPVLENPTILLNNEGNHSVQSDNNNHSTMQIRDFSNIYKMQEKDNARVSTTSRELKQDQKPKRQRSKSKKLKKRKNEKSPSDVSPQFDMPEKQEKALQQNPFKESFVSQSIENGFSQSPQLMQESTAYRYQVHEVKSLKSEVHRLKQQLLFQQEEHKTNMAMMDIELQNKEAEILSYQQKNTDAERKIAKLSKNSTKREDQDKILELEQRFEEMKMLKEKTDEFNKQILKQIGLMKETIKDSQQREALNIQLLEKNRDKGEKIQQLRNHEKALNEQLSKKDHQIQKLKEKLEAQEDIEQRLQELQEENEEVKGKYSKLKAKLKDIELDKNSVEDLIDRNRALEKARDKFRNQTLDQKQEIKKLKAKIEQLESAAYEEEEEERPMRKVTPAKVEDRKLKQISENIKQNMGYHRDDLSEDTNSQSNEEVNRSIRSSEPRNRKNEVIKDIKSLIKQLK